MPPAQMAVMVSERHYSTTSLQYRTIAGALITLYDAWVTVCVLCVKLFQPLVTQRKTAFTDLSPKSTRKHSNNKY